MNELENQSDFLFYSGNNGSIKVQIIVGDETVWATQKSIAEIFRKDVKTINSHISNIYQEGELQEDGTISKNEIVQKEGERSVKREVTFYNLDVIIAVGYRTNSYEATQFRIWATKILKEYMIKGFALDDERLKQSKKMFGKDYFDELLERIREIRASERRFYQKITDIYQQCSIDYDSKSPITKTFFATVQNKLEYAITHHTAPELIKLRANAKEPNMGLTTWKNSGTGGKVLKSDITVAKNYLKQDEIDELNIIVNMYLDYAELQAKRNKAMKMAEWVEKLDTFLAFNEYDILNNAGKVKADVAKAFAEKEYGKFRIIQDKEFQSDFDKIASQIKNTGKLPNEIEAKKEKESGPGFDETLKAAIPIPKPVRKKGKKKE